MKFFTKERLSRLAKAIDGIALFNMILVCFCLVFMLLTMIIPSRRERLYDIITTELEFSEIVINYPHYDDNYLLPEKEILDIKYIYEISVTTAELVVYFLGSWFLRKMMKPLKEAQPFTKEFSAGFKNLAILVFVSGVIFSIASNFFDHFFFEAYEIADRLLVWEETATGGRTMMYSNFQSTSSVSIVTSLLLWVFSILFKHGESLQKESNETL